MQRKYTGKIYDNIHDNSHAVGALTLCIDSNNRIWAGTNGNGLNLYDTHNDSFIPAFNTYFEPGDVVFSMLEDNEKDYGSRPILKCIIFI